MNSESIKRNILENDLRVLAVDLLRGAKRLLWLGVLLAVMGAALSVWRTHSTYRPVYRASASFTVVVTNTLYSDIRTYNASTAEQMEQTFPYILTSDVLTDLVKQKLGVASLPAISAAAMTNTNIFTLSVTSSDPQLAYDVLNTVIECYPDVAEFVVGPTTMSLLDESGVPTAPINSKDYAGAAKQGAVIGVVLWAVIVTLFALTRSTIHNEKELERIMSLRCIGVLPMVKRRGKRGQGAAGPVLSKENDKFGFNESVRLLRIRVEKEMQEQRRKVLLVSSAVPSEGKSTVASNLAIALAHKGKRTLMVDCDLRNPSVAGVFGKKQAVGLSEYLNKKAEIDQIIVPLEPKNLFAVFGGTPVSNASELLGRKEMQEFIEATRRIFDYVILDTPPSSLLADASELALQADCGIMVIQQNHASKSQILDGVQLLADSGLPLIGCVLNGAEGGVLGRSYSYYGYSKAYGSDYTDGTADE